MTVLSSFNIFSFATLIFIPIFSPNGEFSAFASPVSTPPVSNAELLPLTLDFRPLTLLPAH